MGAFDSIVCWQRLEGMEMQNVCGGQKCEPENTKYFIMKKMELFHSHSVTHFTTTRKRKRQSHLTFLVCLIASNLV